ncbi:MAG: tRNA (adenosine(37)-N6)-threonylcarbamoyltransferase complex transferase subunit TsaD [Candidatus Omnitrophica bacterium CG07_land_8_20_14_0_80_42_15]|uniref:tRNA N6-adenosine threonylcarbamoyltransferase n=1 Tax=Candidatus Aquitaenariimonas noxiae TaxID=1974741 RepID=A0A2J0L664_9BACT|nr:MAG: tRNA (adenosine(37)-N6)-threonylcarbamoyltransferase complex transferase subunit TsaD [Candidatus Omnitrophica bacterium CG07_land_8_20_14_0_80_42_15]
MLTLGVETSCDETGVAITDGNKVLSSIVSSSVHLHSRFGGVVPEIASRHHVEFIGYCLRDAFKKANADFGDVKLVSVTQGPGLMGSLLVGVSLAKSISFALDIPIVAVNHVVAHIWSAFLNSERKMSFPFVALVISGGHTSIFHVKSAIKLEPLGQTRDDACGESFDKVAKMLGLGYPGGPIIEKRAKDGDPKRIRFPRSYLGDSLDFSFSGIKTAVLYYIRGKEKNSGKLNASGVNDVSAGFQESVVEVIAKKAVLACKRKKSDHLVVGGGVSINKRLREALIEEARPCDIEVIFPKPEFCLDNAAMVAYLGGELYKNGIVSNLDFKAFQYSEF